MLAKKKDNIRTIDISNQQSEKLKPLVKWPGGKERELQYILPNLPLVFNNYYEPFVGGGAVYTAVQADKYFINDKSNELISLYKVISNNDDFFYLTLGSLVQIWDQLSQIMSVHSSFFINIYGRFKSNEIDINTMWHMLYDFLLANTSNFKDTYSKIVNFDIEYFFIELRKSFVRKVSRIGVLEKTGVLFTERGILDNIETAFKSAFYNNLRIIYNSTSQHFLTKGFRDAIFLFIRNYAYSGMFRYNSKGDFNVPYGGISYNTKSLTKKINYLKSEELSARLKKTTIDSLDFEYFFLENEPDSTDFVFLDPPYDSDFSAYANNTFSKDDQKRLANYLIHKCKAKWMMIIKDTEYIRELYFENNLKIRAYDKKYLVSFMNRNNKGVEHLLITNY